MRKKVRLTAMSVLALSLLASPAAIRAESPEAYDMASVSGTGFSFEDLENWTFVFSSGAGAWGTVLSIDPDGNFECNYHDSDMGDTGEGYPNGTVYVSICTGTFTEPEYVNAYTCRFQIDTMNLQDEPGRQEIQDGVRYIYSDPYGLYNGNDFYLYLPGSPLDQLPEDFLSWVGYYNLSETPDNALPFYGIYNEQEAQGFYGYYETTESGFPEEEGGYIESEILSAEAQAAPLEEQLNSGYLNQSELNNTSYDLYQVWDVALNNIWGYLKDTLDPDTMAALTNEEIQWIHDKEAAVSAAGQEAAGGTLQPLLENDAAAAWTEDRVYELQRRYGAADWSGRDSSDETYGAVA